MKQILILCMSMVISTSMAFAQTYVSASYALLNAKIVISGGTANSAGYTLDNVRIGGITGGRARSASYALDTFKPDKVAIPPNVPTLNSVITPTNISTQTLSGTKDIYTSIYINGYEAVPLNNEQVWHYEVGLEEGDNVFIVTSGNKEGLKSDPVSAIVNLDTIPPNIVIINPPESMITYLGRISVEGLIDGNAFSEERDLHFGLNEIVVEAADDVGNTSSKNIYTYRVMEPVSPPEIPQP